MTFTVQKVFLRVRPGLIGEAFEPGKPFEPAEYFAPSVEPTLTGINGNEQTASPDVISNVNDTSEWGMI